MAITSIEVYGVIIAGWASNSKYAFLGALRASAQMVSSRNCHGFLLPDRHHGDGQHELDGHRAQPGQGAALLTWGWDCSPGNWLPLLPIFFIYMISAVAETNRHPFDVVEGEAEIVAGHMVEYSGMGFAVFFLAEYAAMWLVSILAAIMFLGGWLPPVDALSFIPGWIWLGLKTAAVVSMFIWIVPPSRATAMTKSCAWAGKSSSRSPWCGWSLWVHGCTRLGTSGNKRGHIHGCCYCCAFLTQRFL